MTNEELKKLSDDTFFDNDTGEIQPAGHRNFNNHLIDHTDTLCEATLHNSKEYTDAREVAVLAAADTKDADALKAAKAYADKIVAALAGSAPETLDTLQELAAALGDDPNFSATVMQMLGERVTAAALAEALAGKVDASDTIKNGDLNDYVHHGLYVVDGGAISNAPVSTLNCRVLVIASNPARVTQIAQVYEADRIFFRRKIDAMWEPWRELWHSGNFDPASYFHGGVYVDGSQLNDPELTKGNRAYAVALGGIGGLLVTFSSPASASPLQFYLDRYFGASLKWRNGVDNDRFLEPEFRTIWDSGNMKPTYHAQINPNGQIVSQSADWIQSVQWVSNGNGYRCDIVPKVSVNTATVQVTAVVSSGNYWPDYRMPIVYDTLVNGAITVCIVGKDGASSQHWFNISVQGA